MPRSNLMVITTCRYLQRGKYTQNGDSTFLSNIRTAYCNAPCHNIQDAHDKMAGVSERLVSLVPNVLQANYEDCKELHLTHWHFNW